MTDGPTTKRPNQYGKKTIVLRTTDDRNSARKINISTGLCIGLALIVCSIVSIVIVIYIFGNPSGYPSSKAVVTNCVYEPCDFQYDGRIFNTPRHTTSIPTLPTNTEIYTTNHTGKRTPATHRVIFCSTINMLMKNFGRKKLRKTFCLKRNPWRTLFF